MLSFHDFNHSSGDKFVANIMSLIAVSNPNRSEVELNSYIMLNEVCLDFEKSKNSFLNTHTDNDVPFYKILQFFFSVQT